LVSIKRRKHDIIRTKVPHLSNIFDKVRFASNLPNSKSDHIVSVDKFDSDMIVSNPRRLIEEGNLHASNKIISDSISQCIMKIRKTNNSNILVFKLAPLTLQKFSLHGLILVILELKARNQNQKSILKSDDDIVISTKALDMRIIRKGIAK